MSTTYTPTNLIDRSRRLTGQIAPRLWRCDICYALVDDREVDQEEHGLWHDRLARRLEAVRQDDR